MPPFEHFSFFSSMSHMQVFVNAEFHGHAFWGATWQWAASIDFCSKNRASKACIFIDVWVHVYIYTFTYIYEWVLQRSKRQRKVKSE